MSLDTVALLLFALCWVVISFPTQRWLPIGRVGGALLCAVGVVAFGVRTPEEALASIDTNTILLLFGMMWFVARLEEEGFFGWATVRVLRRARTGAGLITALSVGAGVLSALLVNDTVCVFLTPLVLSLCAHAQVRPLPYLLALATSANIGSAATLVGNPQNMILAGPSGLDFFSFARLAGPSAALALIVNLALLLVAFRRELFAAFRPMDGDPAAPGPHLGRVVLVFAAVVLVLLLGGDLAWTPLYGVAALLLIERRDPRDLLARIDFPLLLFFSTLFIVVSGLRRDGLSDVWLANLPLDAVPSSWSERLRFAAWMTVGSNTVSNVPLTLVVAPEMAERGAGAEAFALLGLCTTFAGNLTLIGSVANLIVAERSQGQMSFWTHLPFGVLTTLISLLIAVALVGG